METRVPNENVARVKVAELFKVVEGTILSLKNEDAIGPTAANTLRLCCKFFKQELDEL